MLTVLVPGSAELVLEHLVLDLNGTLSERGQLIEGVADRLRRLGADLDIWVVTADTLGTARALVADLPIKLETISRGDDKSAFVRGLGSNCTAAIGNGRNDEAMLREAALAIAVIGPEGAAGQTLTVADIVCRSILEALDLLLDTRLLVATLRP